MEDSNMMTKAQFEGELKSWGVGIRSVMQSNLSGHGTGALAKSIKVSVKESNKTETHYVGFNFRRYGIFVAYGVGRGWTRENGSVVRGSRVKKGSVAEILLKHRGYSKKELRSYRIGANRGGGKGRKPLDWFDSVLTHNTESLGDIAAEYYGDYSMQKLTEMMHRMTITKK
jgi:hypothetical protein